MLKLVILLSHLIGMTKIQNAKFKTTLKLIILSIAKPSKRLEFCDLDLLFKLC